MLPLRNAVLSAAMILLAAACSDSATTEPNDNNNQPPVDPPPVASVTLTPGTATLSAGETRQLTATARSAANAVLTGRSFAYTTSKPSVAVVSQSGLVTAIAAGQAKITVTSEGKSAEATITVQQPAAEVASVEIVGLELDTLEMYDLRNLTAIARDADGAIIPNVAFTWSSSHGNVAAVNTTGVVEGMNRGTATIRATSANGKFDEVTRVVVIKYRSITLGTQHACDIASGGIAWCWGLNSVNGRIGLAEVGDGVYRAEPVRVPGDHKFTQLVTYARTTCGLREDGAAYCWGTNNWYALGNGSNVSHSSTPVAVAGNHVFTKLVAGAEHACGLTTTGSLYCWGHGDWGQMGNGNTQSPTLPVLAAGGMQFANVSAGSTVTCGITNVGAAYCWGANGLGQLGIGGQIAYGNVFKNTPQAVVGGHTFASITVGEQFTCGVDTNGKAWCWGIDGHRLGSGNTGDASSPKAVSGGQVFKWLNSGFGHSCGIDSQDKVYCWGSNGYGQLAIAAPFSSVPALAAGGLEASEVDVAGIGTGSGGFTCAISRDRLTVYCWGRNEFGQLGNGTTSIPTAVNNTPTIVVGQKPLEF